MDWVAGLTLGDLTSASTPGAALAAVDVTVHIEQLGPQGGVYDLVVTDPDGNWWSLRMVEDDLGEIAYPEGVFWGRKYLRQHLLTQMLSDPLAGPCPDPTSLVSDLINRTSEAFYAHDFSETMAPRAMHLLAILDSDLCPEHRDAHNLLLGLTNITLPRGDDGGPVSVHLDQIRTWQENRSNPNWMNIADNVMMKAAPTLWPLLFTGPEHLLDEVDLTILLAYPQDTWPEVSLVLTKRAAQDMLAGRNSFVAERDRYNDLVGVWTIVQGRAEEDLIPYLESVINA